MVIETQVCSACTGFRRMCSLFCATKHGASVRESFGSGREKVRVRVPLLIEQTCDFFFVSRGGFVFLMFVVDNFRLVC